jgi:hypothetical protein
MAGVSPERRDAVLGETPVFINGFTRRNWI